MCIHGECEDLMGREKKQMSEGVEMAQYSYKCHTFKASFLHLLSILREDQINESHRKGFLIIQSFKVFQSFLTFCGIM